MKTIVKKKLYEGMFLVDSAKAAADWEGVNTAIKNVLEKAEAEIVSIKKWSELKLAYEIRGKSRGTYILCYFKADGEKIRQIERDVQLSEQIMRVLILSTEAMTQQDIEKDTPAIEAEKRKQKAVRAAEKVKVKQVVAAEAVEAEEAEVSEQPVEDSDAGQQGALETTEAKVADAPERKDAGQLEQEEMAEQKEAKEAEQQETKDLES